MSTIVYASKNQLATGSFVANNAWTSISSGNFSAVYNPGGWTTVSGQGSFTVKKTAKYLIQVVARGFSTGGTSLSYFMAGVSVGGADYEVAADDSQGTLPGVSGFIYLDLTLNQVVTPRVWANASGSPSVRVERFDIVVTEV